MHSYRKHKQSVLRTCKMFVVIKDDASGVDIMSKQKRCLLALTKCSEVRSLRVCSHVVKTVLELNLLLLVLPCIILTLFIAINPASHCKSPALEAE